MSYCFISDLHLEKGNKVRTEAFFRFLKELPKETERLYILGDFFESWIGDDEDNDFIKEVKKNLSNLSQKSIQTFFINGNRDFLLGDIFAKETGIKILKDPTAETMFNKRILLMHGDTLCIDDTDYQAFRKLTRDKSWKKDFISKTLQERREIAKDLREKSKEATSQKKEDIMDVSQQEVERIIQEHNVDILIHGHTHRPDTHDLSLNGNQAQRIVLGDWDQYGWYIWMDSDSCELKSFLIWI